MRKVTEKKENDDCGNSTKIDTQKTLPFMKFKKCEVKNVDCKW